MAWSQAQLDGFALAAIACGDGDAGRAEAGLASDVRALLTEGPRRLAREPAAARRAWVRRVLGEPDHGAGDR